VVIKNKHLDKRSKKKKNSGRNVKAELSSGEILVVQVKGAKYICTNIKSVAINATGIFMPSGCIKTLK
jgi:hypothetical protein